MPIVIEDKKLALFTVPKGASTSLKHLIYRLEYGEVCHEYFDEERGRFWGVHDKYPHIVFSNDRVDNSYRKIAVVRDPVDRFLSAFQNRVPDRRTRKSLVDSGLPSDPDMKFYIANLEKYLKAVPDLRHHIRPMVDWLGEDPTYYDEIFSIREAEKLVVELNGLYGETYELERRQLSQRPITKIAIGEAEQDWIRKEYAKDYEAFGEFL